MTLADILLRLFRAISLGLAILVIVAFGYHLVLRGDEPGYAGNYLSLFTIHSNVFAALVLLLPVLLRGPSPRVRRGGIDSARGAAVTYLVTTGVVHYLLLSNGEGDPFLEPWANILMHRVFPIIVALDWVLRPPARRIPFTRALVWLIYPFAFLIYSLIRGAVVGWYPYPFIDPDAVGAGGIVLYSIGIAIAILALIWLVTAVGHQARRLMPVPAAGSAFNHER